MEDIKNNLLQISDEFNLLLGKSSGLDDNGLYTGNFGILLFLFNYLEFDNSQIKKTEIFASKLVEYHFLENKSHTFCNGLGGVLYFFEYLREQNVVDIDISKEFKINDWLVDRLNSDFKNNYYDFMHGALGLGLYFLKSGNSDMTRVFLKYLEGSAEIDNFNNFYKWKSNEDLSGKWGYNISLSHGISSIIMYLSKVLKSGFSTYSVQKMLTGAVNYVLSQQIDVNVYGSFFPYRSNSDPSQSRLAWCYGDLGIAISIWNAGLIMNNDSWKNKAEQILEYSTLRKRQDDTFVSESGICHGSSGVSLIYRRMYLNTKNKIYLDASEYWLNKTFDFAIEKNGLAGYKSKIREERVNDYSLLSGIAGVGSVFLSHLLQDNQSWDEMFLLSL